MASGRFISVSVNSAVAAGVAAMMAIWCSFSQFNASMPLASTIGTVNKVPVLALTTLGLKTSVHLSQTIKPSNPTASEERNMVPRLPGFSIASATTKKGFFLFLIFKASSCKVSFCCLAIARRPSGRSR